MSKIFTVAKTVFWTRITKPTYYWMILAPLLLGLGAFGVAKYSSSQADANKPTIAVIANQTVRQTIVGQHDKAYKVAKTKNLSYAKTMIKDGSLDGAVVVKDYFKSSEFIYDNLSSATMPYQAIQNDLNQAKAQFTASQLNLTAEDMSGLFGQVDLKQTAYNSQHQKDKPVYNGYTATQLFSQAATILVFFLLTSYISIAGTEIGREKGDHILESVVAAMPAKNHFAGKMLGLIFLIGFQLLVYGLLFLVAKLVLPMVGQGKLLDLSSIHGITAQYAFITILLMVAGMLTYIFAAAILASFVSRSEDISQATSSVASFMLIPYFISFIAQEAPNGTLATVLSYLPFTSYGIMPIRIASFATTYQQGWISVAISFIAVAVIYLFAGKIYERNVFNYSDVKPLKALILTLQRESLNSR